MSKAQEVLKQLQEELFKFLSKTVGYEYNAEDSINAAKEAGMIIEGKHIATEELFARRWGRNTLYVYQIKTTDASYLIGIEVYVMYSDEGEDEFEGIYLVEPYEVVETKYRRISV